MQKSLNQTSEERILDESMRLFLERGYNGTSIDNITQSAGLTKGALYWHFKSKEAVLKRIIEEFEKRFLDELINSAERVKGGAYDKFEKYIHTFWFYYSDEPAPFGIEELFVAKAQIEKHGLPKAMSNWLTE